MQINQIIRREELGEIEYPVGKYLGQGIQTATVMADIIRDEYPLMPIRLICQGSSGAIMAALIAAKTEIHEIVHVKKRGEDSHSFGASVKFNSPTCINIIVDDFISTGATVRRIIEQFYRDNVDEIIDAIIVSKDVDYELLVTGSNACAITIDKLFCKSCDNDSATIEESAVLFGPAMGFTPLLS